MVFAGARFCVWRRARPVCDSIRGGEAVGSPMRGVFSGGSGDCDREEWVRDALTNRRNAREGRPKLKGAQNDENVPRPIVSLHVFVKPPATKKISLMGVSDWWTSHPLGGGPLPLREGELLEAYKPDVTKEKGTYPEGIRQKDLADAEIEVGDRHWERLARFLDFCSLRAMPFERSASSSWATSGHTASS